MVSEAGDGEDHSGVEEVMWRMFVSYHHDHFPQPRSHEGCEPSLGSAAFRRRIKIRVLCACDFLSYTRSHTRGCVLTQGTLIASALAVGAAVVVVTIAFTGLRHTKFTRSYHWSRSHIPFGTNGDNGTNGDFCISYSFRPSVSTSILASAASVEKTFSRLRQLFLSTHFELFTLEFFVGIVGIDGGGAALPTMFFCEFGSLHTQGRCTQIGSKRAILMQLGILHTY